MNIVDCCEYKLHGTECSEMYTCCDCGGGEDCGCAYCWSCNACEHCLLIREGE